MKKFLIFLTLCSLTSYTLTKDEPKENITDSMPKKEAPKLSSPKDPITLLREGPFYAGISAFALLYCLKATGEAFYGSVIKDPVTEYLNLCDKRGMKKSGKLFDEALLKRKHARLALYLRQGVYSLVGAAIVYFNYKNKTIEKTFEYLDYSPE